MTVKDEIMAPNHKLTHLIQGRSVVTTEHAPGKTIVSFDDGSTMRIKTPDAANDSQTAPFQAPAPAMQSESWLDKLTHVFSHETANEVATGQTKSKPETAAEMQDMAKKAAVKDVMQNDTTLVLRFEDGTQTEIALAEASSSVMLRDKDETMEYAD